MDLVNIAVVFLGGYVVVIILAALVMTLQPDLVRVEEAIQLRQREGVMPRKAWGFKPAVTHSHYDPAPWHLQAPTSEEDSLENVERATDIKRELGSEHPPWERLDRQGL